MNKLILILACLACSLSSAHAAAIRTVKLQCESPVSLEGGIQNLSKNSISINVTLSVGVDPVVTIINDQLPLPEDTVKAPAPSIIYTTATETVYLYRNIIDFKGKISAILFSFSGGAYSISNCANVIDDKIVLDTPPDASPSPSPATPKLP